MKLSHLVTAAFGLTLLVASTAGTSSEAVVISTGKEGGSYYYIGGRLKTELLLQNMLVEVRTSLGSLDNLSLLNDPDSPVNVALTQADALNQYLESHPEFADEFLMLGDAGRECVLIIAARGGTTENAADFKHEGAGDISVDDPSSGAAVTLQTMARLEPDFQNVTPVYVPVMEALLQLKVGAAYSKLRAAMIVQRPRRTSPPLETVLKDPKHFRLVPILPADLPNAILPDGSEVYSFERVVVGRKESERHLEVDTLCTRGLLLGAKAKLSKELRSQLVAVMLESGDHIVGTDE